VKCKVIKGVKIEGEYHKPGDWSKRYKPNVIEVDGRSDEVKHYIKIGALQRIKETKESTE